MGLKPLQVVEKWKHVLNPTLSSTCCKVLLLEPQEQWWDTGHWRLGQGVSFNCTVPEKPYGFIYIITNNITGKKYIGKKQMISKRKLPPLKGKARKRSKVVETDWKTYTSSSNEVNADIIKYGKENFTFEIVRWCYSKSQLAYFEAKLQFEHDVLLNENYYNGIINLRISKIK
jgi:hypothetical protein